MEKKCPNCGVPVREGAAFCAKCGSHLAWCPKCGAPIKEGSAFCGSCGANLGGGQPQAASIAPTPKQVVPPAPMPKQVVPPAPVPKMTVPPAPNPRMGNPVATPAPMQPQRVTPVPQRGGSNNKLILIGLAAVVIIGGGFFFMKSDKSSDKPAPVQVQTEQKQQKTASTPAPAPAPKKPELKIALDSPKPEGVFKYFHQKITEHELRDAYECFSPDYKNQVDYSGWAPGYNTTLKSIPENVEVLENDGNKAILSYRLKAVDRAGDTTKTQYFRGQCTLYKIDGLWKIDEITARVD